MKDMDEIVNALVADGMVDRFPNGQVRITDKGKKEVEDSILPSVGMTENLIKSFDDCREALNRIKRRSRMKEDHNWRGDSPSTRRWGEEDDNDP